MKRRVHAPDMAPEPEMLRLLFCSRKLLPFAFGFGGRRFDAVYAGGEAVQEEAVGNIWVSGGVGEEPEGGGFGGTRGLGGSQGNVSVTEGKGEGVRFAVMTGANWLEDRFR